MSSQLHVHSWESILGDLDVHLNSFILEWTWKDSLLVEKKAMDDKFFKQGDVRVGKSAFTACA